MEILFIFLFAALGGLILNLTPCVLPVLPLKVLHFQKLATEGKGSRLLHGGLYAAGIVLSFLALALIVIAVQWMGGFAFWGFQFQNPYFCMALAALMGGLGLHFLGGTKWILQKIKKPTEQLQVKLPYFARLQGKLQDWLTKLREGAPLLGSFAAGCLTTLLGSACCGPFLGYAIGLALASHASIILGAFVAAGLGMAAPYFVLAAFPKLVAWVPRSGPWAKGIKIAAGVGMLLTATWLLLLAL